MTVLDPRRRSSSGLNRARVRLELRRSAGPAVVVTFFVALGVVLAGYTLSKVNPNALSGTETVRFAVSDVTGVQAGINEVRFKGVPVGTIKAVEVRDGRPVLRAEIRRKYGRIYRDAHAELRPNTALQDMYLDIVDRGHAAAGVADPGRPLAPSQTSAPVNVAEVLDMFGPSQRVRLRTLLDQLGNGMADRGRSLRQIFVTTAPFVDAAGRLARQLAARRPQVRRLVHNTTLLTTELGRREQELRTLMDAGATTLSAVQEGAPDLDATLAELPRVLAAVDSSFAATRAVLPDVDGALRALDPVADELGPSLTALRALGAELRPALRELRLPVTRLTPLAQALRPLSADADRAVRALGPQADTVDKVSRDLAACKKGVQGFFQWNASISKFGDSRGPIPRGNVVIGAQSSSLFNDPNEYAPQACTPGRVIGGRVPLAKDKH